MSTSTQQPRRTRREGAGSEGQFYKQQRAAGMSHSEAIERVMDTFDHHGDNAFSYVSKWLSWARAEAEAPAPATPEPEPEPEPDVDPLDALQADLDGRIGELEEQRQRLSLDVLSDDAHAKGEAAQELRDVESELASATAERKRLPIARLERKRRAADAEREAERATREKAGAKIPALEKRVAAAAASINEDGAKWAAAVALHAKLAEQLDDLRAEATGVKPQTFRPRPAYSLPLRHALRGAGVPWAVDFAETVRGPDGPLTTPAVEESPS
jgi:hypothetical protein